MKVFNVTPIGKPRMTQRDRWKNRACVLAYYEFKDTIRDQLGGFVFPNSGSTVTFFLPPPKSWSKKKRREHENQPHMVRPDIDNLLKALLDSLFENDSCVWDVRSRKVYSTTPRIEITKSGGGT